MFNTTYWNSRLKAQEERLDKWVARQNFVKKLPVVLRDVNVISPKVFDGVIAETKAKIKEIKAWIKKNK